MRAPTTAQRLVLRARIVLLAADGHSNPGIAELTGVCTDTARKWRTRFAHTGLEGLADAHRSGRPPRFTPVQVPGQGAGLPAAGSVGAAAVAEHP